MVLAHKRVRDRGKMGFSTAEAQVIAQQFYQLDSVATAFPGEADFNFYLQCPDKKEFLLKISHDEEKKATIDLQNAALQHLQRQEQPFAYPQLQPTTGGEWLGYYAALNGSNHFVRLFCFLPGTLLAKVAEHSPQLLRNLGEQLGALTQALSHFNHTAAQRHLKWDLKQAHWISAHLSALPSEDERDCVRFFLQRFSQITPLLNQLPHSVIHGDANDYNIVVAADGLRVTGFIDFGDLVESATICELAIALAYALLDKPDPLQAATAIITGYHSISPLQEQELSVLFTLIAMRLCTSVVNSALRKKENPHNSYLTISEKPAWALLKKWRVIDEEYATAVFHQACQLKPSTEILAIRRKVIAKNVKLSYEKPLHIVRGLGQYLFDEEGRRYLDCVNNVCHVGHCHPKVVAAGQKQMALLNTNTRYLHENLTAYAEKLLATLPAPLSVCFFVCSGSEANELALRLASAHTGRRDIAVLEHAYHGNTSSLIAISPYKFNGVGGQGKPDYVHVLPTPDPLRKPTVTLPNLTQPLAAFIGESLLSCGGQIVLTPAYVQAVYEVVRAAGGVIIADEVQVGLGRVGSEFWGFATQGVVPDIVTLGKPLGNGHPIGAVITTPEIAASFANGMEYFNSFGGNPVSCSIGLAVLEVLDEENLPRHAFVTGNYLKQQLQALQSKHACIGDVRGLGLFLGIELVSDSALTPASALTSQVINHMKERGILLSSDGPGQNVIKIKPPLVFNQENCDCLVDNLHEVLAAYG